MLAKAGMDVCGVDLAPAMLDIARTKSPSTVSYFLGNAENLPFAPGAFDCVTISLALHEMAYPARMKVAGEILKVLAPGGKLLVFDYAGLQNMGFAPAPGLLGLLEKIAGSEHFGNFVQFTRAGGIDRFFEVFESTRPGGIDLSSKEFLLRPIKSKARFMGALRLVIYEKDPRNYGSAA